MAHEMCRGASVPQACSFTVRGEGGDVGVAFIKSQHRGRESNSSAAWARVHVCVRGLHVWEKTMAHTLRGGEQVGI